MMKIILAFVLLLSFSASGQQAVSLLNELKSFKKSQLVEDVQNKDKSNLNIDKMFKALQKLESVYAKEKMSQEMVEQSCRVAELTFINDPSEFAAEIIFPLYQKQKADFTKAILKLKLQRCQNALENLEREKREGNG